MTRSTSHPARLVSSTGFGPGGDRVVDDRWWRSLWLDRGSPGRATLAGDRFVWHSLLPARVRRLEFRRGDVDRAQVQGRRNAELTFLDGRHLRIDIALEHLGPWFAVAGYQVLTSPARPDRTTVLRPGEPFEWVDVGR